MKNLLILVTAMLLPLSTSASELQNVEKYLVNGPIEVWTLTYSSVNAICTITHKDRVNVICIAEDTEDPIEQVKREMHMTNLQVLIKQKIHIDWLETHKRKMKFLHSLKPSSIKEMLDNIVETEGS